MFPMHNLTFLLRPNLVVIDVYYVFYEWLQECKTCPECTQDVSVQVQNLVIKQQQGLNSLPHPFLPDARCTQSTCKMHARRVWDACERYLGAELYRMYVAFVASPFCLV